MRENAEALFSLKQAAEYLEQKTGTIYTPVSLSLLIRTKKLKALKKGRIWMIGQSALDAYFDVPQDSASPSSFSIFKHAVSLTLLSLIFIPSLLVGVSLVSRIVPLAEKPLQPVLIYAAQVPVEVADKETNTTELLQGSLYEEQTTKTYQLNVKNNSVGLEIKGLQSQPSKPLSVQLANPDSKKDNNIKTKIVFVDDKALSFTQADVSLQKLSPKDKVNAILSCPTEKFNQTTSTCDKWELSPAVPRDKGSSIAFQTSHFSAVAGAYLEILNVESNLTTGDFWETNFRTFSQSDLTIQAVDGTHYPDDISFEGVFCGENQIPDDQISWPDSDTLTISNYSCDGKVSKIRNTAVSSGRHWLSLSFGDTENAKAHNFACNTGTLNDTCTVSSSNTMNNGDTISGTGNLTVANGGTITAAAGNLFTINMSGGSSTVTIQSGGTISGNLTSLNAATLDVQTGGSINVDGKGSGAASGAGAGAAGVNDNGGGGGGHGGAGGNGNSGSGGGVHGSSTQPTTLGSGGGNGTGCTTRAGGAGGGAVKLVVTGTTTVSGSITANGNNGLTDGCGASALDGGGGSGGSVWIQTGTLAGAGSITANGGSGDTHGGGGGGGRIAIYYTTDSSSITPATYGSTGSQRGGPGTVFKKTPSQTNGDLIWNNNANDSAVAIADNISAATFDSITISNWVNYNSGTITTTTFTINSGGTLAHSAAGTALVINATGDATITGSIGLNGRGSGAASGAGAGAAGVNDNGGGGGGHGGAGGNGNSGSGGGVHGSSTQPTTLGSGGGNGTGCTTRAGGAGGGAVKLVVTGTTTVSGSITANGNNGLTDGCGAPALDGGGGSGGSVWIQTGTLAGAGSITANGGSGDTHGGGGGGGRVSLVYITKTFSGTLTKNGGTGTNAGSAGTLSEVLFPSTAITAMCSVAGNTCTVAGAAASPQGGYVLRNFAGTASADPGTSVSSVDISIKDTVTGQWYSAVANAFNQGSENWLAATGTATWTYNTASAPPWVLNRTYTVRSRATDANSNVQIAPTSLNFQYINAPPTVSNVTASQGSAGTVTVSYDVSDAEDAGTTISLYFKAVGTVNESLTSGDTTAITVSDSSLFPTSGTIMIESEIITYTAKSGNDLAGTITRATDNTVAAAHASSTAIYIKATTVSGDTGSVTDGNGKSITWTAKTDFDAYYSTSATVKVASKDSSNDFGTGESASYTLDTKNPTSPSISIASAAATTTSYTVTLTLSATDDTMSSGVSGQMKISNSSDLAADGLNADSGNWITYNTSVASWTLTTGDGTKTVYIQFKDSKGNTTSTVNDTISKTSPPTVSNVTSSQSATGTVTVAYDVTDPVQSSTTISLYYKSLATVNEALASNDTTAITVSSGTLFPSSGTLMIENEIITYTSKSGNDLQGTITRGVSSTTAAAHNSGTAIYIKTVTVSGNAGAAITNGTGKSITWTAKSDVDGYYSATSVMKVLADDGNSTDNIGNADSANFSLDTKDPALGSPSIVVDATASPAAVTLSATDDTALQMKVSLNSDLAGASQVSYAASTTITLATDPDTVYAKFYDARGNSTTTVSATTPETPTALMVQDTTNVRLTPAEYRVFIAWKVTAVPPSAAFKRYNVMRSTDNSTYASIATITNINTNSYADSSVVFNTLYYYKVSTQDNNDDISYLSSAISAKANGTQDAGEGGGGSDATGPTISSIAAGTPNTSSVTVTWTTDELSDSTVLYSTDASYSSTQGVTSYVTSHSVTLVGLAPNTTYNFKARSIDPSTNSTTSSASTFTTASADTTSPTISSVSSSGATSKKATITWTTNEAANSFVLWSASSGFTTPNADGVYGFFDSVTSHSVTLPAVLTPSTTYYYLVQSTDAAGNTRTSSQSSFATSAASSDSTVPTISAISAGTPGVNTATITWTTNENSSSFIEFGTSTSYGRVAGQYDAATSHSVALPRDLAANTTYNYRVRSTDGAGNEKISANQTFTTASSSADSTAPVISSVSAGEATATSITVTWSTDELSDSLIEYSVTAGSFLLSQGSPTMATSHSITLVGLTPSTQYYYRVKSTDAAGNTGTANNGGNGFTFGTGASSSSPPVISSIEIKDVTTSTATITWATNKAATSIVEFGFDTSYGRTAGKFDSVTSHSVSLPSDLLSDIAYHFRIRSTDADNNTAVSKDLTFTTNPSQAVTIAEDTTAPAISSVTAVLTSQTGATITWVTNEDATSQVEYGITVSLGTSTTEDTTYTTQHSVTISNLTAATTYYFQVISKDRSNNSTTSDNAGQKYSFATSAPSGSTTIVYGNVQDTTAPTISGIKVSSVTQNSAVLAWDTSEYADSFVKYGTTKSTYSTTSGQFESVTSHKVTLQNLTSGTVYYFVLQGKDTAGNLGSSSEQSFTTEGTAPAAPKEQPKTEEKKPEAPKAEEKKAEPSKEEQKKEEQKDITKELPIFEPQSPITLRVQSAEQIVEGIGVSEFVKRASQTFIDQLIEAFPARWTIRNIEEERFISSIREASSRIVSAPSINGSDIEVSPGPRSAVVRWSTDKKSNSLISLASEKEYNPNKENPYTTTAGTPDEQVTQHLVTLTGLDPGTTYHYQIQSQGQLGPVAKTEDRTFATASLNPEIIDAAFTEIKEDKITLVWKTDLPTRTIIEATDAVTGRKTLQEDKSYLKDHTFTLESLKPSSAYILRLTAEDEDGNSSSSSLLPFSTSASTEPPIISQVRVTSSLIPERADTAQTIISWKTNKPSTSQIFYIEGISANKDFILHTPEDTALVTEHIVITTAFKTGRVYQFKAQSSDPSGNTSLSNPYTILTPKPRQSVVDLIIRNFEDTFQFMKRVGL